MTIETINLTGKTNGEIQKLWNDLSRAFEGKGNKCPVGFLELSRETERRGLVLDKNKFGNIILQPKSTTVV